MITMNLETQIVQDAMGLLSLVVTAGLAYFTPKLKTLIEHHTNAQRANVANSVINGLSNIATSVVKNFNQTVVESAKKSDGWTPLFALQVKQDAINAVKSQGAALIQLGNGVLGDVDNLVSSLVEQAVVNSKLSVAAPVTTHPTQSADRLK